VAWGNNFYGQTNVPLNLTNLAAIACGAFHSLALASNGVLVAWGDNALGQTNLPANFTNASRLAAGGAHGLTVNSTSLVAWGNNFYNQTNAPFAWTNVLALAAGSYHSLALLPVPTLAFAPPQLGATGLQLQLNGAAGVAPVVIYATTNFSDWQVVFTNPPSVGAINFVVSATNSPRRFYRAQSP
jgi:hypothetical protein